MSKDHLFCLYTQPDLDSPAIQLSHHRTIIVTTGIVEEDISPWPLSRKRELYERVNLSQRGSTDQPITLYRRIR